MKIVFTESSLSSFEDFHDSDWLKQVAQLVKGTEIEGLFEEFAAHWLGSARAFILPWLLANGVYDEINSIIPLPTSPQDVWNGYLKITGFHAALWKLSEGMYCSIYYAYENLLVNLLQKITGKKIRVTDRDFAKVMIEVYGDKFTNKTWNGNFISVSREIRNCIVHNGGMVSKRLLEINPRPHIKKENVIISASDTRKLYNKLKPVVYETFGESIKILRQKAG
jgi:hypothetical protein